MRNLAAAAGTLVALLLAGGVGLAPGAPAAASVPGLREFTLVSVRIGNDDFWLPSTIAVNQGDRVKIILKNDIPGSRAQHGFSIPGYNITAVVTRGELKDLEFTADKPGVYPYFCQFYPAHIGGELIVLPK